MYLGRRVVRPLALFFAMFSAGVFGCLVFFWLFFGDSGPHSKDVRVLLVSGTSLSDIAELLKHSGVLEEPALFRLGTKLMGKEKKLKAGEYLIPAMASPWQILEMLEDGTTIIRRVTVPEGLTSKEIVRLINNIDGLMGKIEKIPAEGTLLPETYYYSWGDLRKGLLDRMSLAMRKVVAEAWRNRAPVLSINTPDQAVVLASIIEKETALTQERTRISAVFHNRLRLGMRLQSDPTVIYGLLIIGEPVRGTLNRSDLKRPSIYNTYTIRGLPPGPISNPGRESIEAALNPKSSLDLFFVANGLGGHAFSKTLSEHRRNVARWQSIRFSRQ